MSLVTWKYINFLSYVPPQNVPQCFGHFLTFSSFRGKFQKDDNNLQTLLCMDVFQNILTFLFWKEIWEEQHKPWKIKLRIVSLSLIFIPSVFYSIMLNFQGIEYLRANLTFQNKFWTKSIQILSFAIYTRKQNRVDAISC